MKTKMLLLAGAVGILFGASSQSIAQGPYWYRPGYHPFPAPVPVVEVVVPGRCHRYYHAAPVDVQIALGKHGYYHGPVDGVVGPKTRKAIVEYQYDRHLPVSGRIDYPLTRSLGL